MKRPFCIRNGTVGLFEIGRRAEFQDFTCGDLHLRPRAGIASRAGRPLHDAEGPEPRHGEAFALPECTDRDTDRGIDRFFRRDFRESRFEGDRLGKLSFVHIPRIDPDWLGALLFAGRQR